jgi:DNA ligase (NAD+)
VITGKLDDFKNRNEAGEYLRSLGFKVTTSISKNTDYLVDETGKSSSKRTKAESLNIPIVTIKQLVNLI